MARHLCYGTLIFKWCVGALYATAVKYWIPYQLLEYQFNRCEILCTSVPYKNKNECTFIHINTQFIKRK